MLKHNIWDIKHTKNYNKDEINLCANKFDYKILKIAS